MVKLGAGACCSCIVQALKPCMHHSCGTQEVSRDAVVKAFKSLGSLAAELKDDNILAKCQHMCQEYDLSPTDLAYKWEAHTDKVVVCLRARMCGCNMHIAACISFTSLCCHVLSRSQNNEYQLTCIALVFWIHVVAAQQLGLLEVTPEMKHFEGIEHVIIKALRDKDAKLAKSSKTVAKSISRIVVTKDTVDQLQDQLASNYGAVTQKIKLEAPPATPGFNSFVTPAKRGRPVDTPGSLPTASRARVLPTPTSKDFLATPGETPDSMKYSAREEKFKIMSTMNEALGAAEPMEHSSSRCEIKLLQGIQLYKGGRAVAHRYMFEKVEQKCMTLRDRLRSITDGIIMHNNLRAKALEEDGSELQLAPVNMPTQDKAWYCGRICCEGDAGSINASSVLLEGANGKRVKLELAHVAQFAVFPGQIVVLRGNNTSGESIIVREMWSDASLPMAKTPADKMATWNESESFLGGMPLSMMTASGPFTSSTDLLYKPLEDLLDHVTEQKPDIVILTGPFVDCKHRQLNPEAAGSAGGFSNGEPPDSLQVVRHVMRDMIVEKLAAGSPHTTCVLVPCIDDLHSRTTFPQPSFDQAEIIQAMEGESDVSQRVDVHLVGNPCVLRINELIVGICTADPIRSLSGNEASRSPGDRMTRLASHIVQQRSFYPLFPPAEGSQLSMANINMLSLEQSPDVLLLPSQLNPFAKRIGDVLCVNPGRLTKGSGPGTFARFTVHPIVRHLRSGPAGGSRKVTAGLASGIAESPEKAEAQASDTAASVSPQQLSQNFESAAAESKAAEKDSDAPAAQGDAEGKAEGENDEGKEVPVAATDKMQVETDATTTTGEAAAAATAAETAAAAVTRPAAEDGKVELPHRVCERTRIDIVRI